MSRGIALTFRRAFGRISELRQQSPRVGGVVFLVHRGVFIYYLVTKNRFYHKPQLHDYLTALHSLRDTLVSHNVQELSIPELGCGLDNIPPQQFYSSLYLIFRGDPMTINVYKL